MKKKTRKRAPRKPLPDAIQLAFAKVLVELGEAVAKEPMTSGDWADLAMGLYFVAGMAEKEGRHAHG